MIKNLYYIDGAGSDPHYNLAVEQYLLEHLQPGDYVLYLWQNQNTVVIGANQNAWTECRVSLLEEENGTLARRLSGGGAVFHDLGNLNFTFLSPTDIHDLDKQIRVIASACAMAGIRAERSGRNDILAQGRKFSGNAFYHSQGNSYHHGTLLIHADMDKLQRYLSPSKAKLDAKGVASVRSRVVNLSELAPDLTIDRMRQNMKAAFEAEFGMAATPITLSEDALAEIAALAEKNRSWEHLFGTPLPFSFSCEDRFSWGGILLELDAKGGTIQAVRVYSDAMDWHLPQVVETALTGCRFTKQDMIRALENAINDASVCQDLCGLIQSQDL